MKAPRGALRLALAGVVTVAAALLISTASEREPRPSHRAFWVQSGAKRLRAVRAGAGTSIVLLHGYGESLIAWRALFDRLAHGADVVALDLPGFGLSSKPASGYATDSLAADVLRALDALGIERTVLVGHSLGGAVAAAASITAPGRVRALVLVDPAVVTSLRLDEAVRRLKAGIAEYEALRPRFTSPHDRAWLAEPDSEATAYTPAGDSTYREALQAVLREFDFGYLSAGRSRLVRTPTLLIWGEFDQLLPRGLGEALARELPNARLAIVRRSWHRPHVERPDEVAALIVQFLDTH